MNCRIKLIYVMLFFLHHIFAQTDSLRLDSILTKQVQNEIQQIPVTQQRVAASANPDISVIGDFRMLYRSHGTHNVDAVLHESEFSFQSVVDPYIRADFFYSVGEDESTGKFSGEIEEGYLTTLALPEHLQLKAGRFRQQVGRLNPVHPHALSFIDLPDAYLNFFGEEGLKGDGLSLSWLLPNHSFFQELTLEATNVSENPSFQRSNKNNFLYLAHLKNFWDLSPNATLELGLSGIRGENLYQKITNIAAIDLTYKWKPIQYNTYKSLTFQNEFYYSHADLDSVQVKSIGYYSLLSYQIAKRWFLTGRFDYSNNPYSAQFIQKSGTLTFGFLATEFQKIEIETRYTHVNQFLSQYDDKKKFAKVSLRWIYIIGSHGAHQY